MVLPTSAVDHYRQQQGIAVAAATQVQGMWASMGEDFDTSWSRISPSVNETVSAAQVAAAATGINYVGSVLAETDVDAPPVATLSARSFAGLAYPDGRPLGTLLDGSVVRAKEAVAAGLSVSAALSQARDWLGGTVLDSVRFANRQAVAAEITVRPKVQGWVRMLNPPSCKFCVTLAGKWFRWNQGFQSHPNCDCRHIPAQESKSGDLTVDPYAYFRSLEPGMQDRIWGKKDAQAIRDGSDIYRVVNVRSRGLSTSKQARKFGTPSRKTVDDIYATAKNREQAIKMLTDEGYVTGPQRAGGNILGNQPSDQAILARGRGRGTYRVGTETVTTARAARYDAVATGQRDPLNRSTMTAGERRIYDDFYRAEQALLSRQARTIGGNSADRGTVFTSLTAEEADVLKMTFLRRIERVRRSGTPQEKALAELLFARYNARL